MFLAIILFVVIFGFIVLAHEFGHFYTAIKTGTKVEEFGLGLPPRIWGFRKNKVLYSINWVPFGGFVKIHGENEDIKDDKTAFSNKTAAQRSLMVSAGILMNLLTGWVVIMLGFWLSMPPLVTQPELYADNPELIQSKVIVVDVEEGSPAEQAGIIAGDYILGSKDIEIKNTDDLHALLSGQVGRAINFDIERGGELINIDLIPVLDEGEPVIGTWVDRDVKNVHYTWWKVPWLALVETWRLIAVITSAIAGFIYQLFTTASVSTDFTGPVGIVNIATDLLKLGWLKVLQFVAFISINLGLINLIPFPALDGGRLLFIIVEVLRGGKKVSSQIEAATHTIGFMLLILLILVITYRDIVRLF